VACEAQATGSYAVAGQTAGRDLVGRRYSSASDIEVEVLIRVEVDARLKRVYAELALKHTALTDFVGLKL